jgi:hypothetical protein
MSQDIELYKTWGDDSSKQQAFSEAADAYNENSAIGREKALGYSYRSYIDIEPNRSVRTSITRNDYYRFRPEEAVPTRQKRILKMAMDAYDRVGIIRNVIDLMGDFGSQGVDIVHPNKSIERFYKAWFKQVKGQEKSERFLNYLYRTGNVIVKRSTAKINAAREDELRKSVAADMEIVDRKYVKREIPWQYDFLNPLTIDVLNYYNGMFLGEPIYVMNLSKTTYDTFTAADMSGKQTFSKLPPDIQAQIKQGKRQIRIDPETIEVFYYKKDDWLVWANPMLYAILDDLIMLEKMKLADLAALDGAISQIRLWTVGSLDHKIIPKKDVINKLRDIIASNTGGGTMDLIWGPELSFKESSSDAYKFLGKEKYEPVLTSIYAGLGIPPSLAGATSGGSYADNYVSLKTLIERLEYGRMLLTQFWNKEIKHIQKAMGFKLPAQIRFDNIILSDESAEKQLLVNLADRGILSDQTILERFGEIPEIERLRVRREEQSRRSDISTPMKASPYHNPNVRNDVAKVLVTKDGLADEYYHDELDLPKRKIPTPPAAKPPIGGGNPIPDAPKSVDGKPQGGRPSGNKDKIKRKTKTIGETAATLWAYDVQKSIAEEVTPMMLDFYKKKNVRSLTKAEFDQLEHFKLCLLTNIEPFIELTPEIIKELIDKNGKPSAEFLGKVDAQVSEFVYIKSRKPTVDEMKYIYASVYVDSLELEEMSD